jgi:hypothetical protein
MALPLLKGGVGVHDQQERDQILAILADLPYGDPVRAAFRGGADALMLARLVDRPELALRLIEAWQAGYLRSRHRDGED